MGGKTDAPPSSRLQNADIPIIETARSEPRPVEHVAQKPKKIRSAKPYRYTDDDVMMLKALHSHRELVRRREAYQRFSESVPEQASEKDCQIFLDPQSYETRYVS